MKHFNWLVKHLFYKHKEVEASPEKTGAGVFYTVGFVDQIHANLCTNASESMLNHFAGRPFSTMVTNPREMMQGATPDKAHYRSREISMAQIETTLKRDGPFIMLLPLKYHAGHSVVVTGCTKTHVIYNDPLTDGHRMIAMDELKNLCAENSGRVEIATANFFNSTQLANQAQTTLPEKPENIIPNDYQEFFSLDKMNDPCKAVLDFLQDYAKSSLWHSGRHHKETIKQFIEENKDNKDLRALMFNLNKAFPKEALNNKSELFKRLLTVEKIMNQSNADTQPSNTPTP